MLCFFRSQIRRKSRIKFDVEILAHFVLQSNFSPSLKCEVNLIIYDIRGCQIRVGFILFGWTFLQFFSESIMSKSVTHCVIHSRSMNFHFNVISLLTSRFKRVWKSKRQSEKNKNETFIDQSHHNLCTSAKLIWWGQSFCFFMALNIIPSFNTLHQSWTSWDVSENPLRKDSLSLFLAWWHNLMMLVFILPQWTSQPTWLGAVNLTEHLWSFLTPTKKKKKQESVFCQNFPFLSSFFALWHYFYDS